VVLRNRLAEERRSHSLVAVAGVVVAIVRPVAVGSSGIHSRRPDSTARPRRVAPSSAETKLDAVCGVWVVFAFDRWKLPR
jgi:hypothetical protein